MNLLLLAALGAVVLIAILFWFARKPAEPSQEKVARRAVACKECGAQIGITNAKLGHEFSLKCSACETRNFYNLVDLEVSR